MTYADNVIAGWYYLSGLTDRDEKEKAFNQLQKSLSYIPAEFQTYYSWYCDYYRNYEQFPTWEQFRNTAQMENDCALKPTEAASLYHQNLAIWESDSLCERMKALPLHDRKSMVERLAQLHQSEVTDEAPLLSASSFQLDGNMIKKTEEVKDNSFRFPIKHLNDVCKIRQGVTISVIAPPGMMKTVTMENIVYLNSVEGKLNSLYIYLENLPTAYMADLYARYSFTTGNKVENASLKAGVPDEDVAAVQTITKLKADFDAYKKGEIYFKAFHEYPKDPLEFGSALARDINKYKIDIVYFDYIQRAKVFAPIRIDTLTYLNQIFSTVAQVSLGGFGADHASISVIGVQPNREAQQKADRTKGNSLSASSCAECSSVERDSYVMITQYADAESKAAGQMNYKVVKNRDGAVDVTVLTTPCMLQYAYIGDNMAGTDDNIFTNDAIDDLFDLDL